MRILFNHAFFFSLLSLLLSACTERINAEPEIYLIPKGYEGSFYVVFNVLSGKNPMYEGKFRVYRIPENGILLTQSPFNAGRLKSTEIKFFFIDKNKKRIPIKHRIFGAVEDTLANRNDKEIYIFSGATGTQELGRGKLSERCTISTIKFAVGTKQQILDGIKDIDLFKVFAKPPFPCQ